MCKFLNQKMYVFWKKPALNAGTTDKVTRIELREKDEEAAILSPDNGRYKKSEAREKRLG